MLTPEQLRQQMEDLVEQHRQGASNVPPVDAEVPGEATQPEQVDAAPSEGSFTRAAHEFLQSGKAAPAPNGYRNELAGLMSSYQSALKESNRRKGITGWATSQMALTAPNAAEAYGKQFDAYNNEPLDRLAGPMAAAQKANEVEKSTGAIEDERELDDPSSPISQSVRDLLRTQFGMEVDDSVSASKAKNVIPGILTQVGQNQRTSARNQTTETVAKENVEQKKAHDALKDEQFRVSEEHKLSEKAKDRAAAFLRVQERNKGQGTNIILQQGLGQRETAGGSGGGADISGVSLVNITGGGKNDYLVFKPGISMDKSSMSDTVKRVQHLNQNMGVAMEAMNRVKEIIANPDKFSLREWNSLIQKVYIAAQSQNKVDDNGVMNFSDFSNSMKELGSPTSPTNLARAILDNPGAVDQIEDAINALGDRYNAFVSTSGLIPTNKPNQPQGSGGGSGSHGGPINQVNPGAVEEIAKKYGVGEPVVKQRSTGVSPQQTQSQSQAAPQAQSAGPADGTVARVKNSDGSTTVFVRKNGKWVVQ